MKNIRRIILVIIICLLIILTMIISLIINTKNDKSNNSSENLVNKNNVNNSTPSIQNSENSLNADNMIIEDEEVEEIIYDTIQDVTNQTYFFTVQNCIQTYLNDVNNLQKEPTNENKQKVYNQLSEKYIQENNVLLDNLGDYTYSIDDLSLVYITRMVQIQIENNGIIRFGLRVLFLNEKKNIDYLNFVVYMDYFNLTYAIKPISSQSTDFGNIDLKDNVSSIPENANNRYTYIVTTTEELLENYLKIFNSMAINIPEVAYEYLEDEYKAETFTTVEDFNEFITRNQKWLEDVEIDTYNINQGEDNVQYGLVDTNGIAYIIREKAIMQFTIVLDANH